jgi:alkylation response protein AidB-like acyl-CoA dehydrogenase
VGHRREKYWIGNGVEADWVTVYAETNRRGRPLL